MSPESQPPEICPVCGESVPRRARCCPECGADEKSGWDEQATRYDGLGLPDDNSDPVQPKAGRLLLWSAVAIGLLALLVFSLVFRR